MIQEMIWVLIFLVIVSLATILIVEIVNYVEGKRSPW
jgi:NADH:ubiquinone oxidoreductase subunit 3 (subunit A)